LNRELLFAKTGEKNATDKILQHGYKEGTISKTQFSVWVKEFHDVS
jgi:hypothetical protein